MADDNRNSLINQYFQSGLKYKEIVQILFTQHGILISLRQVKRVLRKLRLSRRTYSCIVDVVNFIQGELRTSANLLGYRMMTVKCQQNGYNVRMNDVRLILKQLDPIGVELRQARRLRRRAYYANGPNFIWHMDGYDKLKPFGLCINGCICGFSRKIIWLKVYHTNSNPKIIGGYFMEAVKELGGCPRIVRADYGTENGHVRDFQYFLRRDDPDASRAYIDGASTANQRIESWWGYLRKNHIQFWIELFKSLQESGTFGGDYLDKNLVLFCFLALIQEELDVAAAMWNMHTIRPSRNPNVPSGRPDVMYCAPSLWNTEDNLRDVSVNDIVTCCQEAEFRSVIPCDADVYDMCITIMRGGRLYPTHSADQAVDLYLKLRRDILALV